MKTEAAEIAAAGIASKSTYAGAASLVLGWLTSSEAAVLFGIVVGICGLAVNWYYKAKADRRAEVAFQARMARIQDSRRTDDTDPEEELPQLSNNTQR